MLHDPTIQTRPAETNHFSDINAWWRAQGTCINGSWRKFQKAVDKSSRNKVKEKEEEVEVAKKTKAEAEKEKEEKEKEEEEPEVKLP
jgi:hypothetical protein